MPPFRHLVTASLLAASLLGCSSWPSPVAPPAHRAEAGKTIVVVPRLDPAYMPQTLFQPHTRETIEHLVLRLYTLEGEPAAEQPVLGSAGEPVQLDLPASSLGQPVSFSHLRPNTRYRVRALAYNGPGTSEAELISTLDEGSYVDVAIATDDGPIQVQLRVRLRDRNTFAAPVGGNLGLAEGESLTAGDERAPEAAYNAANDQFLVVWRDDRLGSESVYGRRLSGAGTALGGDIPLLVGRRPAATPAVAHGPGGYLLVWHEAREGTGHDILAQRVSETGTLLGSEIVVSASAGEQYQPRIALEPSTGEFLVVWYEQRGSTGLDIVARRLGSDGSPQGDSFVVSDGPNDQLLPRLAHNPGPGGFMVVWQEERGGTGYDILARRVASDGTLSASEVVVSAATTDQEQPVLVHNPLNDRFLIVWQERRATTGYDIIGKVIDPNGDSLTSDFAIAAGASHEERPELAFNRAAREYQVHWQAHRGATGHDLLGRRLRSNGGFASSEFVVAGGPRHESRATLAQPGSTGQTLIAWQHADTSGDIHFSLLSGSTASPQPLGSPVRAYSVQKSARLAADTRQAQHLLTWVEPGAAGAIVQAQRVDHAGGALAPPSALSASASAKDALAAAFNPATGEFLVVWQEYRGDSGWDIVGQRVGADGLPAGAGIVIASEAHHEEQPAVAFNSLTAEFLVVWQACRSNRSYDMVGARLAADGTLLGGGLVLAASPQQQLQPAIAFHPRAGEYMLVWYEHRTGTAWDVLGRRIGPTGGPIGDALVLAGGAQYEEQPVIACHPGADEYMLVWQAHRGATGYDILCQRLAADGRALASFALATGVQDEEQPAIAYNPAADEFLVAWQVRRAEADHDLFCRRLTGSGSPIGEAFAAAAAAGDQVEPRLSYLPATNDFLLCWRDTRSTPGGSNLDVYLQRIDSFASP